MPWPHQQERCQRGLDPAEKERVRRSYCGGHLRTLYVRDIQEGQPVGWTPVGTVCLRCHHVELNEEALPPEPRG
jgi:hypothetical protein